MRLGAVKTRPEYFVMLSAFLSNPVHYSTGIMIKTTRYVKRCIQIGHAACYWLQFS